MSTVLVVVAVLALIQAVLYVIAQRSPVQK